MWEITVAIFVIVLVLSFIWRRKNLSTFSELGIPGPEPSLLFGNIIELYTKGPLKCHEEWVAKYGRLVGYYYGMKPILLVADPQLLKSIFIKDFSKFVDRVPFDPLQSPHGSDVNLKSVLNLRGQKWKQVRSVLTPTFSAAKMKKMSPSLNSAIDSMLDIMRQKAKSGEVFNIHDNFQRLTMDVITKVAFGVSTDVQRNPDSGLLHVAKVIFSTEYKSILSLIGLCFPSLRWIMLQVTILRNAVLNKGVKPGKMLRTGMEKVIKLRREKPETRKSDLLQLMLDTKISVGENQEFSNKSLEAGHNDEEDKEVDSQKSTRTMTDDEVVASSITVFLAGYETTSTALAFTSYLLAKYPDVQERAFEEICDLIAKGEKLEYGSVNKLPYLDKVLNESMRIYPPVYLFVNRFASEDVDYGGLRIPERMHVQAPVYLLHHDPEYWPDPETFDPERFNAKPNSDGITYLPFGIGPRNCMGMRFAQMEAKLALCNMIYNFKLEIGSSQQEKFRISMRLQTLAPTDGVNVKLLPREHETAL